MQRAMLLWHGAACAALALAACKQEPDLRQEPPPVAAPGDTAQQPGGPAAKPQQPVAPGAQVDTIKEQPQRFYGKTVRVFGEVDEVYSDRAFELEGNEWAFNDNITVLTKKPIRIAGDPIGMDYEVIVQGTVRQFVAADLEREIGWDITPDVEAKINKRPVIVAETIRRVGEYGEWSATAAPDAPVTSTLVIVATIDPKSLAGRKVDLGRERVQAITTKGLWVGPSAMGQVFVHTAQPPTDVKIGDWVQVSGTLQRAPKDAAKAWGLPPKMEGMVTEDMVFVDSATVKKAETPPAAGTPAGKPTGQAPRQDMH